MKGSDLRELSEQELRQQLSDSRQELMNMRIQQSTGQLERPLKMRSVRRDIARMRTVMHERGIS